MAEEIIKDIFWTDSAKKSFSKIIDYLDTHWSEREVGNFFNETLYLLSNIKRQPEMCRPSIKRKNVRIGIINKHTQLVYH